MSTLDEFARSLRGTSQSPTLVLERRYATTGEDLWAAITTPDRVSRWFGTIRPPAPVAVGDVFEVDLGGGADDVGRGQIVECERPRRLAFRWQWQGEAPSHLLAELRADGDAVVLRLVHSDVDPAHLAGYGGGWEQVMLALNDELTGTARYAPEFARHEHAANELWHHRIAELRGSGGQ